MMGAGPLGDHMGGSTSAPRSAVAAVMLSAPPLLLVGARWSLNSRPDWAGARRAAVVSWLLSCYARWLMHRSWLRALVVVLTFA